MKNTQRAFYIIIGLSWWLMGCDAEHNNISTAQASTAVITIEQMEAYRATLYSFGQTQGCVNCHSTRVNPAWMNGDLRLAYSVAAPHVDFTHPEASVFAIYASNNHCGDPICADPNTRAIVQGIITDWANAEMTFANGQLPPGSTLPNPTYVTATMPLPSSLPLITAATPGVMRFNLSQLTPPIPALNNALLEVSVASYNSAFNKYKVFNPRVIGLTSPVRFTGLHVYVRPTSGTGLGIEDINQGTQWANINTMAQVFARPATLPTGPITGANPLTSISLGVQSQSTADSLTIGFAGIQ